MPGHLSHYIEGGFIIRSIRCDDLAWADYLITRGGLLLFSAILLISVFKVHPLFFQQDTAGWLDAELSHLASYLEAADAAVVENSCYYEFGTPDEVTIGMSCRYVAASTNTTSGTMVRARALMTPVYPPNSLWNNSSGLRSAVADRCHGRTGTDEDVLVAGDWEGVSEMLQLVEDELAGSPYIPETAQPLVVEKVLLNYLGPEGLERRGITIVYQ